MRLGPSSSNGMRRKWTNENKRQNFWGWWRSNQTISGEDKKKRKRKRKENERSRWKHVLKMAEGLLVNTTKYFGWGRDKLKWRNRGQWLWRSWQSSRFRHQRSTVGILSLANNLSVYLSMAWYWKDQNKEREAEIGPFLKVEVQSLNMFVLILRNSKV